MKGGGGEGGGAPRSLPFPLLAPGKKVRAYGIQGIEAGVEPQAGHPDCSRQRDTLFDRIHLLYCVTAALG